MSDSLDNSPRNRKQELRAELRRIRDALHHRAARSVVIADRVFELLGRSELFAAAICGEKPAALRNSVDAAAVTSNRRRVLMYFGVRSEVQTGVLLERLLADPRFEAVLPACVGSELHLFRVQSPEELAVGRFGIPEPSAVVQAAPDRRVAPEDIDAAVVPGLAFDRSGGRLGYGAGFFDRTLRRCRPEVPRIGLAFCRQLVDDCPQEAHDVRLHFVVTETEVLRCAVPDRPAAAERLPQ